MKNTLIIGDNKEALECEIYLNSSYKVIYLDPPYNTRSIKSYNDTEGSDVWSTLIKDRLKLCKKYLKNDGVIFISIDDSEIGTIRVLCDKIFGYHNFLGTFITRQATRSNGKHINTIHEYVVCYAKDKSKVKPWAVKRVDTEDGEWMRKLEKDVRNIWIDNIDAAEKYLKNYIKNSGLSWLKNYNLIDDEGRIFFASDLSTPSNPRIVDIPEIGLHLEALSKRGWTSDKRFIELYNKGLLHYRDGRPYEKKFLMESEDNCPSILNFYSRQGTKDLKDLGLDGLFDTPKSVDLLKHLFQFVLEENDNVLDIYGGSGSTAQACKELNKNISWTIIQRNENVDMKSTIYKNCIKIGVEPNIPSILKKRLSAISADYECVIL